MNSNRATPVIVVVALVIVAGLAGYFILNAPDRRDAGERFGDAVDQLHNGPDKAVRELESRTPGDKLKDAVHDEKNDLKKSLNQH